MNDAKVQTESLPFCAQCVTPLTNAPSARAPSIQSAATRSPQSYTPAHLAEKIHTSRTALEGEHKQVTELFADPKGTMALLADRHPNKARQLPDPVLGRRVDAVHSDTEKERYICRRSPASPIRPSSTSPGS
jgi:hypothetical protein